MTKETMIWHTLNWIVAGMVKNKTLPDSVEEFEKVCISNARKMIAYPEDDIRKVFRNTDITEFSQVLAKIYPK
jgi:hypothetical protein